MLISKVYQAQQSDILLFFFIAPLYSISGCWALANKLKKDPYKYPAILPYNEINCLWNPWTDGSYPPDTSRVGLDAPREPNVLVTLYTASRGGPGE